MESRRFSAILTIGLVGILIGPSVPREVGANATSGYDEGLVKLPGEQLNNKELSLTEKEELQGSSSTNLGKVIGRWRNSGIALAPKWRDGDVLPTVPFDSAKVPNNLSSQSSSLREVTASLNNKYLAYGDDPIISPKRSEKSLNRSKDTQRRPSDNNFERLALRYQETFQNQDNDYELIDEEYRRPRPRKRRPPQIYEIDDISPPVRDNKKSNNYDRNTNIRNKTKLQLENSELKNLLKMQQGEGVSLSEILQRQNLSLSDLLQGKEDVINLLKSKRFQNEDVIKEDELTNAMAEMWQTTKATPTERTTVTDNSQHVEDHLSDQEKNLTSETNPSNSTQLPMYDNNSSDYSEITTEVGQSTTSFPDSIANFTIKPAEKEHLNGSNVVNKQEFKFVKNKSDEEEIMEFSDNSSKINTDENLPLNIDSESTLSLEQILSSTENTRSANNNSGDFSSSKILEMEYPNDDFAYNLSNENTKNIEDVNNDAVNDNIQLHDEKDFENIMRYSEILSEAEPDVKAELFELLSSGSSAKRLERLLKSRNMSLDEFIALRQRGSSKAYLNEVTKHRDVKKYSESNQNQTSDFEVEEKHKEDKLIQNRETLQHFSEHGSKNNELGDAVVIQKPMEIIDLLSAFGSRPMSEIMENDSIENSYYTSLLSDKLLNKKNAAKISGNPVNASKNTDSMVQSYTLKSNIDGIIIRHQENRDKKRFSNLKPTLFAIGMILGVTIIVFLAIYITCKARQKERYMHRNSFTKNVFQTPITSIRKLSNSSSLNAVMVNVISSNVKQTNNRQNAESVYREYEFRSDVENDSLDTNDSWRTIPEYM